MAAPRPADPYFDGSAKVLAKMEQQMDEHGLRAEQRVTGDKNLYERFKVKKALFPAQQQAARDALYAADEVHSLPPLETDRYRKVELSFKKQDALGFTDAYSQRETGKVLMTIDRELAPAQVGLTMLHETGHLIDLMYFKPVNVLAESGIVKPEIEAILSAARETRAWQQYEGRLRLDPHDDDALYLTNPKELWARAYAQYIAEKSGNETLLAAVKEQAATGYNQLPEHWSSADFTPVRQAIDHLFYAKGWLR
ncbi:hypothetical protein A0257_07130 [Hymenobacter psoromatis]|nr:hypothetical protein A0257_07130 [Hymenobacter psoromatis]